MPNNSELDTSENSNPSKACPWCISRLRFPVIWSHSGRPMLQPPPGTLRRRRLGMPLPPTATSTATRTLSVQERCLSLSSRFYSILLLTLQVYRCTMAMSIHKTHGRTLHVTYIKLNISVEMFFCPCMYNVTSQSNNIVGNHSNIT